MDMRIIPGDGESTSLAAQRVAQVVIEGFNKHYRLFRECSASAKERFENADWLGVQQATRERIQFYDARVLETTALGAAYLAGLAVGLWKSREQIAAQWRMERRFEPTMPRGEAQALLGRWREAVKRSLAWA